MKSTYNSSSVRNVQAGAVHGDRLQHPRRPRSLMLSIYLARSSFYRMCCVYGVCMFHTCESTIRKPSPFFSLRPFLMAPATIVFIVLLPTLFFLRRSSRPWFRRRFASCKQTLSAATASSTRSRTSTTAICRPSRSTCA